MSLCSSHQPYNSRPNSHLGSDATFNSMAEVVPAVAPAAEPVKAPVTAKAKGSTTKRRSAAAQRGKGPTVAKQILEVLAELNQPRGSSVQAIKKALRVKGMDVDSKNRHVNLVIRVLQNKGKIVQVKGSGASGTFKLVKEETRKRSKSKASKSPAQKPAVKKVRVSKPSTPKADKKKKKKTALKSAKRPAAKKSSPKRKPKPTQKRSGKLTPQKPKKLSVTKGTQRKSATSTKTSRK